MVDLDDGHPYPLVRHRQQRGRQQRSGGADAYRALGEVQLKPDMFARGGVFDAPAGGQGRAEQEAPAVLAVRGAEVEPAALERDLTLRIVVGDLDAYAVLGTEAEHIGRRARVDHGVGDQLAGEDDGVVDDIVVPPPLEGVPDKGAGGRDRAPDRFEGGGRARGDHSTPHMVSRRFPESCARFSPLRFACQARRSSRVPGTRGPRSGQDGTGRARAHECASRWQGRGASGGGCPPTCSGLVRCNDLTSARPPVDGVVWR